MKRKEMNQKASSILEKWDPFEKEKNIYANEITKVLKVLYQTDDPTDLAKHIRDIYEQSFHFWIPIEDCVDVSYKLLAVKYKALSIV